jgi:hypothetical protein
MTGEFSECYVFDFNSNADDLRNVQRKLQVLMDSTRYLNVISCVLMNILKLIDSSSNYDVDLLFTVQ